MCRPLVKRQFIPMKRLNSNIRNNKTITMKKKDCRLSSPFNGFRSFQTLIFFLHVMKTFQIAWILSYSHYNFILSLSELKEREIILSTFSTEAKRKKKQCNNFNCMVRYSAHIYIWKQAANVAQMCIIICDVRLFWAPMNAFNQKCGVSVSERATLYAHKQIYT